MEWNKQTLRGWLTVVCTGVVLFCALQNLGAVLDAAGALAGIFTPFLLGGAIAFVLNVPMRAIEKRLLANKTRGRRPAALLLALAAVIGVLALAGVVIAPGVNKGTGVDMLAQIMDVEPENVFCGGDGWNDLAMVGHGRQFFAPAGAIEPLKAMDVTVVGPVDHALEDMVNILEDLYR